MLDQKNPITVDEILVLVDKATQLEVEYQQALRIDVGVQQAGMASGEADIALRAAIGALVAERDALARSLRAAEVVIAGLEDRAIRTAQTFAATAQRAADVDSEREANAVLTAEVEALRVEIERMSGITHLEQINDGLIEENETLRAALKDAGLFLHHCWCDVQMNEYSWEKLNVTMAAIDAAMKEQRNG